MKKLIVLILLFTSFCLSAQNELKFQRFKVENGLPANDVIAISQDHKGFMWFGMRGGCCRYDGFSFKTFPVQTHSGIVEITTWLTSFVLDKQNKFWAGEMGQFGFLLFDYNNEVFINYTDSLQLPDNVSKISISELFCDSRGLLWIATVNDGIITFNTETGESKIINSVNIPEYKGGNLVKSFAEDADGNIWIGTGQGLFMFDYNSNKFYSYNYLPELGLDISNEMVVDLVVDPRNMLWFSISKKGLFCYDIKRSKFSSFTHNPQNKYSISSNNTGFLTLGPNNNIWLSSSKGLNFLNRENMAFDKYFHDENKIESINSNIIRTIFIDKTDNIWVGTAEGCAKVEKLKFKSYKYSRNKNSISQNKVQFITQSSHQNQVWFALPDGIDVYDRQSGEFKQLIKVTKSQGGLLGSPLAFSEETDRGMWIATYRGGVQFYDYKTQRLTYYTTDQNNPNSISDNFVFSILVDKNKNIWMSSWGNGIDVFEQKTGHFRNFKQIEGNDESILSNNIRIIFQDEKNRIWFGTRHGVGLLKDYKKGTFTRILDDKIIRTNNNVTVTSIHEANNGNYYWIGSYIGLFRYHFDSKDIIHYTKNSGLPSTKIMSIQEDKQNNLWIGTSNGLAKTKPDYNKSDSILECKVYKKSDGLQGNEFLAGSYCQLSDGTMLFGGTSGFSMFNPDSILNDTIPPEISLTELRLANKQVKIGQEINGQVVLNKSITNTSKLSLNYKNNEFSIEFVALHFNQPQNNTYAYKLVNYDKDWHYVDGFNRKASYMNLNAGNYIFLVKAANCDGKWNPEEISLQIEITPPWWQTWWFRIGIAISLLMIFISFYKYRVRALKERQRILEQKVNERTAELREANSQLEEKQEEIMQQNEEIITVNNQIKE